MPRCVRRGPPIRPKAGTHLAFPQSYEVIQRLADNDGRTCAFGDRVASAQNSRSPCFVALNRSSVAGQSLTSTLDSEQSVNNLSPNIR
jgi:hypothetical protein